MLSGDFLSEFTQIESIEFKIKSGKFAGTHQLNKIIAKKNPDLPDATVSTKMKSDNKQSVIIDGLNTGVGAELILDDGSYFKAFLYLENYSVNFDTKVGEDDHAPYLSLRDKPTVTISDFKLSVPSLDDDISRAMIEKEKENIKEGLQPAVAKVFNHIINEQLSKLNDILEDKQLDLLLPANVHNPYISLDGIYTADGYLTLKYKSQAHDEHESVGEWMPLPHHLETDGEYTVIFSPDLFGEIYNSFFNEMIDFSLPPSNSDQQITAGSFKYVSPYFNKHQNSLVKINVQKIEHKIPVFQVYYFDTVAVNIPLHATLQVDNDKAFEFDTDIWITLPTSPVDWTTICSLSNIASLEIWNTRGVDSDVGPINVYSFEQVVNSALKDGKNTEMLSGPIRKVFCGEMNDDAVSYQVGHNYVAIKKAI